MNVLKIAALALITLVLVALGILLSGVFNVAADDPHSAATRWLLEAARDRSIAARAGGITVPPLGDPKQIAIGAEHYSQMCAKCHLAPGTESSDLRRGLYPRPPNLVEHASDLSPQETFWIIKHGLKMTGMPAWGATHDDDSIWAIVAFLHKLPELSPEAYRAIVGAQSADADPHEHAQHHQADEAGHGEGALPKIGPAKGP
jgi:mono/diheme cytochrome c family protein